jgi:hypothetical protein
MCAFVGIIQLKKSTDVHHSSLLGLHHSMGTQKKKEIIEKWHEGVTSNTCMTTLMCNQSLSLSVFQDRLCMQHCTILSAPPRL